MRYIKLCLVESCRDCYYAKNKKKMRIERSTIKGSKK